MPLELIPGRFYLSRAGDVWCCFRRRADWRDLYTPGPHAAYDCIRVADERIEYFYADGRYDVESGRLHTLVRECSSTGAPIEPAGGSE